MIRRTQWDPFQDLQDKLDATPDEAMLRGTAWPCTSARVDRDRGSAVSCDRQRPHGASRPR